jgi:hypothetical protein
MSVNGRPLVIVAAAQFNGGNLYIYMYLYNDINDIYHI